MAKDTLLTTKEFAAAARVTVSTVKRWVANGTVKPRAWTPSGRPMFSAEDALLSKKPV